ncbi:hypothetical protein I79_017610 [Cricetulus griseus]|uniref:Uncharacterized protein n=1 Tax=Cricetulus griseus TaxID=10029 RepID=G3I2G8_CRIGR|nr:hypothetical protein I79_017610 [Cricetulus griseus]
MEASNKRLCDWSWSWEDQCTIQQHKWTLTTAGEAIPVQFIALVTTTQEGPIGVEAALLTWGSHVTLIHI